jgi:tellurite resistance protein
LEAYDEVRKIASSEQVSKESEARLKAFAIMARLGVFNAAVIRDAESDEIAQLIDEVEKTNYELSEELEKLKKRRLEEERERSRFGV